MDRYRSKGSKRNYEQPNPKQQREKRKSNFNHYDNFNLNSPVNFISSGSNDQSKTDDDNDEFNRNRNSCQRNPTPPPPPITSALDFKFHDTPQLKGIGGKLLLQMGYEPGKGLGKNLQGIQVPIKAKPRLGRGAIGAYGPENINSLPIETITTVSKSRGYNNKFVANGNIVKINDDHHLIDNVSDDTNNEQDDTNNNEQDDKNKDEQHDDAIVKKLTNIVMALSDETNKISSTTQTIDTTFEENNYEINLLKNDVDINSSWNLSILCYEYPKLKLTEDQFEQIEFKIFNLFYDSTNDTDFNEPLQFHKSALVNGTMQFLCANESTKNWLYQIIDNNNLLNNVKLKIVETDSLRKYKQIKFWLSGPKLPADRILKTLQRQNRCLKTDKWRVYDLNYFRNFNSTELIVGIDCISLAELKKVNLKPFYRFGRCVAHLSN